ncbi:MAG: type IV pilin protein [Planctomycetota bacterium]|jgi:prepilin-type N-terminal cleavage/methylation domain-containing protein
MNRTTRNTSTGGFTLLELLIVVAVIAVLSSMAIPNLLASRVTANETVAVAALKSILAAQVQCQALCLVDVDGDGRGEALGLDELCGTHALRSGARALSPSPLPQSLGLLNNFGHVAGRGYLLCLFLPDANGVGIPATPDNASIVDPDMAENFWSCVAWPQSHSVTGNETFWTNQSGEVMRTVGGRYDGRTLVPEAGAALVGTSANSLVGGRPSSGVVAADGNRWTAVQ